MRETVAFLKELAANNNKLWFDDNRARYRVLRNRFEEFTAELIDGIGTFDAEVRGLTPKDCIFRAPKGHVLPLLFLNNFPK